MVEAGKIEETVEHKGCHCGLDPQSPDKLNMINY